MPKKSPSKMTVLSCFFRYAFFSFVTSFFAVLFVAGSLIKWTATSLANTFDINYFRADLILMTFSFAGMLVISKIARNKIKYYGFSLGLFVAVLLALVYYHIWLFV